MDQQIIPWALYDLSGAHAPDSLEPCRTASGVSADNAERVLKVSHTTLCRVPGAPSSGDGTGCLKMVEASQCGSPPIIHSARYAIECARTLGMKIDSATSTNEGCYSCDSMPRPTRDEWRRNIAEHPLSELEQSEIGKYERSMHEWRAATTRGVPRRQYSASTAESISAG
uniref:Uncharacterized protein n=1 Tax=Hyaloperonospora arabidopsidis (strain Emoy2) TaxID=559515 RepID=M4B821_HYAAE